MKKVGIMTWYTYYNYGSVLQAAALYYQVKLLGYNPELIRYIPRGNVKSLKKLNKSECYAKVLKKVNCIHLKPYNSEQREKLFEEYLQVYTSESECYRTFPELKNHSKDYTAFICGSDQIWSPGVFDDKYFLSFEDNESKLISYGPSIGATQIQNEYIHNEMQKLISRFHHLSVREDSGAEIIRGLTGRDAEIVLDPTLLLDKNDWGNLVKPSLDFTKISKENYTICYFLGDYRKYGRCVSKISSYIGTKVYVIPSFVGQIEDNNRLPFDVGPNEFVELIKNAKYVITDSFHATAFAINFNKPFTVFKRFSDNEVGSQNSRIYNILKMTGFENRLVDEKHFKPTSRLLKCSFEEANIVLKSERKKSINYLSNALILATQSADLVSSKSVFMVDKMCSGCGACAAICPMKAISINYNSEGFLHSNVNIKSCINCGKCREVCPFINIDAYDLKDSMSLYSFKLDNKKDLAQSSSGGAGQQIAKKFLEQGFSVAGCVYERQTDSAKHVLMDQDNKNVLLNRICGSKYIQSDCTEVFSKIKDLCMIRSDFKIVFFGTPCQIAACNNLLQRFHHRQDVILIDLICHGVPSRLLWNKYLNEIEQINKIGAHPEVCFRAQGSKWRDRHIQISDLNHSYYKGEKADVFYTFFRHGLCDIPTCYECPYREKTFADIRMGDYWGPRFKSDKEGVSMLIGVTALGNNVIAELEGKKQKFDLQEYWNVQMPYNSSKYVEYENLINDLKNPTISISKLEEKYAAVFERQEKIAEIMHMLKLMRVKFLNLHK